MIEMSIRVFLRAAAIVAAAFVAANASAAVCGSGNYVPCLTTPQGDGPINMQVGQTLTVFAWAQTNVGCVSGAAPCGWPYSTSLQIQDGLIGVAAGSTTQSGGLYSLQRSFPITTAGVHQIRVWWDSLREASAPITVNVSKATPVVSLAVEPLNGPIIRAGDGFRITATVNGYAATGEVNFDRVVGSGPYVFDQRQGLSGGSASYITGTVVAGNLTFLAAYLGDSNNSFATSSPLTVPISKAVSQVSLSASVESTVNTNQKFNLSAQVSGMNPSGVVKFTAGEIVLGEAVVVNGVANLDQVSIPSVGNVVIKANYLGDGNNEVSESSTFSLTVKADPATWLPVLFELLN